LDTVQIATTEFLHTQISALQEAITKKDEYIVRLQDEVSQKTTTIYTVKAERQNLVNSVKEYVIESLRDREIMEGTAEALAEICDFELTKTVTITATVDFDIEVEVPFDTDAEDVANSLEFSVDAFDYSIDDYSVDVQSVQSADSIS
jgi:hypothetical protein